MSETALMVLLIVCVAVAVGGFATGLRLVRRVRSEAEAMRAEQDGDS